MEFSTKTSVVLICKDCNTFERITLGDLPMTPKRLFVVPTTIQCISCMRVIPICIEAGKEDG